ncbi:MAG: ferritin [Chloroflexi bacterium]|nr:ferritin [Chloroflexota bacterium]
MGKKGTNIVEVDVSALVEDLNRAFCDEWLAFYQYWLSARLVGGPQSPSLAAAFRKAAASELEHAGELADRITQLGGTPLMNPGQWQEKANCSYSEPPDDPREWKEMVKNASDGEVCAIEVYQGLAKKVRDGDPVTFNLIVHILAEEVGHEELFENLLRG